MSRISFIFLLMLMGWGTAWGQVATWLIHPEHDNISLSKGETLIITEQDGAKSLWNLNGTKLSTTATRDMIQPFADGCAVTTTTRGDFITGFYTPDGRFTPLNVPVAYSSTNFNDGYLLAKDGDYYCFIGKDGKISKTNLVTARPFSNGYASCSMYKNHEKQKDEYPVLLLPGMLEVQLKHDGEVFKDDDVNFISSVNDEHVGIVIAKEKVFYFNGKTRTLKPMYATRNGSPDKKDRQLKIDKSQWITQSKHGTRITAQDKKRQVVINLDELYRPTSIQFADNETYYYEKNEPLERELASPLVITHDQGQGEGKCGLNWGKEREVLPPQFDKIGLLFGDKAMVMSDGKWGLLQVYPDDKFDITINKGNKIAFKHKTVEAPIRLNVPARIPISKTKLEILPDADNEGRIGCHIMHQTARPSKSYDGSAPGFIDYDCELDFPPYLPDEIDDTDLESNEISYTAQVTYDGLKSPMIPIKAYGWQYKYITPYITDGTVQNGNYYCTLKLERTLAMGEPIYPVKVTVLADTLMHELNKTSEDLYSITIYGLSEGTNTFEIMLSEGDEQIPIDTSFEVRVPYSKPSRNSAATKQPVKLKADVARKKTVKPRKSKSSTKQVTKEEPEFRWH